MEIEEIRIGPAPAPAVNAHYVEPDTANGEYLRLEKDAAYRQMYRYAEDMHRLLRDRDWAMTELRLARRETLYRLAIMVEMRDAGSSAGMLRIGLCAALVAWRIGMPPDYCDSLASAAPLRDIGMIGVKRHDKKANDGLGMREHPMIGAMILGGSFAPELRMAEDIALTHHERFDGLGYPSGLAGRDIPLSGRIVHAVEALERLMMKYPAHPSEEVTRRLSAQAGKQLDDSIVAALLECAEQYAAVRAHIDGIEPAKLPLLAEKLPDLWRAFV